MQPALLITPGIQVAEALHGTSPWMMFLAISALMVLLREFASNTAAAGEMLKTGFALDLVCIAVITLWGLLSLQALSLR
jgi:di/tricarboxylate transporter